MQYLSKLESINTTPSQVESKLPIHALMLLMVTLVASSFPVGAAITHDLPPVVMMFLRFLAAALFFAPYVFGRNGLTLPPAKALLNYALLSLPLVGYFWCMFEALRTTSALNTSALYTTLPAMTAIASFFVIKQARCGRRSLGLLSGTIGALWIVFRGDLSALLSLQLNAGDLLFLFGCILLSLYNAFLKKVYSGEPQEVMTFWVISFGALALLLVSLPSFGQVTWTEVEPSTYIGVLYLALFTTLFTFFLLQMGTQKLGPTKVAAYSYLTPVLVMIFTVVLGTEQLSWRLAPGALLVMLAMWLIQTQPRAKA